ncbi:MAG: hypothetical protein NVS9B4_25540 [Candidatus Acidiferrum sp.]
MARAVMQPLTPSERMRLVAPNGKKMHSYAARFIKPNDRLTSFERLEIYNRQYWFRVLSSLSEDFPGLRAVLGERRFSAMSTAYVEDCPSRSFTLRNLGARLGTWIKAHPQWAGAKQALALDMFLLEWADIEAFDARSEPPLRPEDLSAAAASLGTSLRVKLQPYITLLSLRYPVDDLLLEVKDSDENTVVASNAFHERKKRRRVQKFVKLQPAAIFLAVHRIDNSVYFRRLDAEEYAILLALQQGKTLDRAVQIGFRSSAVPLDERAAFVQRCFRDWGVLGWFCRSENAESQRVPAAAFTEKRVVKPANNNRRAR